MAKGGLRDLTAYVRALLDHENGTVRLFYIFPFSPSESLDRINPLFPVDSGDDDRTDSTPPQAAPG